MKIRSVTEQDLPVLKRIATAMSARHEENYFERCLLEQREGRRTLFIAEDEGEAVGYAQLNWLPLYPPFRRLGMPEIQDLNVVPGARGRGAGGLLVDRCEEEARREGKAAMGISVGLHGRFGAAQRLYVKRGYVPDGAGVMHDETPVNPGDLRPMDDLFTLKLAKDL